MSYNPDQPRNEFGRWTVGGKTLPTAMYHVTTTDRVKSILHQGLKSGQPISTGSENENYSGGIHLASDWKSLLDGEHLWELTSEHKNLHVVKVNISGIEHKLKFDNEFSGDEPFIPLVHHGDIPASRIIDSFQVESKNGKYNVVKPNSNLMSDSERKFFKS